MPEQVVFEDFSPGIVTTLGPTRPAPMGSAQETSTYRCISLPSGGLGPLPKPVLQTLPSIAFDTNANITSGPHIVGWKMSSFVNSTGGGTWDNGEGGIVIVEYLYNNAGNINRRVKIYAISYQGTPAITLIESNSYTTAAVNSFHGSTIVLTRALATAPYTAVGRPVFALEWNNVETDGTPAEDVCFAYPDPDAPTTNTYHDIAAATASIISGYLLAHQNRIVMLRRGGVNLGALGAVDFVEEIYITDPPNSLDLIDLETVFSQENPSGYGAWGSISAGELFLVKNSGGGVLVQGDIENPTVITLPGVTPTYGLACEGVATPLGFVYASNGNGLWLWNGDNTSTKVSDNIRDDFHTIGGDQYVAGGIIAISVQCFFWHDWVYVTNNWLWDTQSSAWWRYEDTANATFQWVSGGGSKVCYAAQKTATYTGSQHNFVWKIDKEVLSDSYSWKSNIIPYSQNRMMEVREILLVASGHASQLSTVTLTFEDEDGNTQAETITFTNAKVVRLRRNTFLKGENLTMRIEASTAGSQPAPTIHSITLSLNDGSMVNPGSG